ncbi:hypothetical protein AHAS_Ahas12G0115400 [Arachis hypogaea]
MADDIPKDGHIAFDSEAREEEQYNDERALVIPPQANEGRGATRDAHTSNREGHRISSEVHRPKAFGPRDPTEIMGLVHGYQGQQEQLEQELERQQESERLLKREV